jgi:hypothetical protein
MRRPRRLDCAFYGFKELNMYGPKLAGVRFPAEVRDVSLLHRVRTGSVLQPASYPTVTGAPSSG